MIRNSFKFTPLLLIFFITFSAHADLVSEFGLSLSKTSVNKFLSQISGEFKINNEEIDLGKVGVLKDLKYSSSKLFLDADLDFKLGLDDALDANANARSIGINFKDFSYTNVQIIKQKGVKARVTTSIKCDELIIELKSWTVGLMSPIEFKEGRFVLNQESGFLNPKGQEISIDLSTCTAPKGIDIILKDLILKWISSPEGNTALFGTVLNYGQEFIDVEFDKLKNSLNLDILNKRIDLVFDTVSFLKEKIEIVGLLKAESDKSSYVLSLNRSSFEDARTGADVVLPKKFFSKMFPDFMKEVMVGLELTRADVPQADTLFNSRLLQFFVWRDLLNFKKSSRFLANIEIDTKSLELKESGSNFKYQLRGEHQTDLDFLNSSGRRYPYIDFRGEMSADLSVGFTSRGLSIDIEKPNLSAEAKWDDDMFSWRKSRVKGKPEMSIIVPQIKKALEKTHYNYTWSALGLGDYIKKANLYHTERSTFIGVSLN